MVRVLIIHDLERETPQGTVRWAYANRSHALQKYAPDWCTVDRWSVYQVQAAHKNQGHEAFTGRYDVVFNLDYQSASVMRVCIPKTIPMISSFNKDSSANSEYWKPCYINSDFIVCNNLDRFLWAISCGYERMCYISNGVDCEFWDSDRPMKDREFDVSWCGSTAPKKGKGFHNVILPLGDSLKCNTSFRPIINSHSNAIYTTDQQKEWYSRSKIFLCASKTEGGGPSSLMEAMACGCAPITTNIGNVPEFGIDEKNCLLQIDNPHMFQQDIEYLLDNTSYMEDVGREARQTIRRRYAYGSADGPDKWFFELFRQIANRKQVRKFDYKTVHWSEM